MSDLTIGLITGAALFGLYSWWVIDVAATVACKRMEKQFIAAMSDEENEDDIIDRLDRMWEKKDEPQ